MSVENGKVCCNCRHCIRERNEETLYTECHCEISGVYLSYQSVMGDWCRHWEGPEEAAEIVARECPYDIDGAAEATRVDTDEAWTI